MSQRTPTQHNKINKITLIVASSQVLSTITR
jgi:hypothetical protein